MVRSLSGFAARVRTGYCGQGCQVATQTVASAIIAVGQTIALATGTNPTKLHGSSNSIQRLSQMFAIEAKTDPPTMKKLPIEVAIPNDIADTNCLLGTSYGDQVVGYLILTKATWNNTKQMVQFKVEDITFFGHNDSGYLWQLPFIATDTEHSQAHSATMKLDNKNNDFTRCLHTPRE